MQVNEPDEDVSCLLFSAQYKEKKIQIHGLFNPEK